jgi:hypothetical protein
MGNSFSEYFIFERLIDGENQIVIGILSSDKKNSKNPYSSQGIKIGSNGQIKRLQNFIETQNSLIFEYEDNIVLTLTKREGNIIINLKQPDTKTIIKPMDLVCRDFFKTIGFGDLSSEYDLIPDFIKPINDNDTIV